MTKKIKDYNSNLTKGLCKLGERNTHTLNGGKVIVASGECKGKQVQEIWSSERDLKEQFAKEEKK